LNSFHDRFLNLKIKQTTLSFLRQLLDVIDPAGIR
jgi:hypothetical protein